jgi:hypothetical protein
LGGKAVEDLPGKSVKVAVQIGTTRKDFYVTTADVAGVLGVSANELSQLYRSNVVERIVDPRNPKAVVYPVFDTIRRYCQYRREKRLAIHEKFLQEKAGRERATRLKVEMFNRERGGELVDKQKLIERLEPIIAAFREQMLARSERLERQLSRVKGRKEKVAAIRAADVDSLGVLGDLFKVLGKSETTGNGAPRKTKVH